jgi:transcriptional regulator with XRE-family HTH domain
VSTHRSGRYRQSLDARALLAQQGLTVTAAERASGLCRGSLSRILTGKRGRAVQHETVRRLSRGTRIPLAQWADALQHTRDSNAARQRAELARLEAEREP